MTASNNNLVLEHNQKAASMWSGGGRAYDAISLGVAEGIRHGAIRLGAKPSEEILDIATGTGWTARYIARSGASLTGVDVAEGLLHAARDLASEEGVAINWQLGDAEKLPLSDTSFDGVISTFGIMFAVNQEAAVSELTRVVRPNGRISVVAWEPNGNAAKLRQVVMPFMPAAPAPQSPPPSPFNWGDPAWLESALSDRFELGHETGVLYHRLASTAEAWEVYSSGFPPVQAIASMLEPSRRDEMRQAFEDWVRQYQTSLGVAIPYEYMVTAGTKR